MKLSNNGKMKLAFLFRVEDLRNEAMQMNKR
jgi:hypothetical protein